MGTNFYFKNNERSNLIHIGKRSASGLYCYDCGMSLINSDINPRLNGKKVYGTDAVHTGFERDKLDVCPICGKHQDDIITNVRYSCSFTFALSPRNLLIHLNRIDRYPDEYTIIDEYDKTYTASEFIEMFKEIPIKYYHSVDVDFS